jgi:mycobactin lysine-N-oxygenase
MIAGNDLLVIGAGPKAMAIAAKCQVLGGLGFSVPRVHVIERRKVAANWTGDSGYTNGLLQLGTSPEKDVGFPYRSTCWGDEIGKIVDERMTRTSWQSFLIATDLFSDWVDRGRPAPEHRQWARYLQWVAGMVADTITLHHGDVHRIAIQDGRWRLTYRSPHAGDRSVEGDGLVLTGPGKTRIEEAIPAHDHVMTVETFWKHRARFRDAGRAKIAIVGAGENAASIAMELALHGDPALEIEVISHAGMIYSRGESFRENRVFSDPDAGSWRRLSEHDRRSFIRRTDRGVFSVAAQRILDQVDNIEIVPGRLRGVAITGAGRVELSLAYDGGLEERESDYVVLAMGSDQLALLRSAVHERTRDEILEQTGLDELTDEAIEPLIEQHLEVRGLTPRLHLPMLSGMTQGPGLANLSCLGRFSDLLLMTYVEQGARQTTPPPISTRTVPGRLWLGGG